MRLRCFSAMYISYYTLLISFLEHLELAVHNYCQNKSRRQFDVFRIYIVPSSALSVYIPKVCERLVLSFYDKCASVNKDLSDNGHTFMDIKIINSEGGQVKRDTLGKYVETE